MSVELRASVDEVPICKADGWGIIKALCDGKSITIKGQVGNVSPGDVIECAGVWEQSPKYGLQFRAASIRVASPRSEVEMKHFLVNRFKGIGPARADKIMEIYRPAPQSGIDIFDAIAADPALLRKVKGLKEVDRLKIGQDCKTKQEELKVAKFLLDNGIVGENASKLQTMYGLDAVEALTRRPYEVLLGSSRLKFGFGRADEIARRIMGDRSSFERLKFGIFAHLKRKCKREGCCAQARPLLVQNCAVLLEVEESEVDEAIGRMLDESRGDTRAETFSGVSRAASGGTERPSPAEMEKTDKLAVVSICSRLKEGDELIYPTKLYNAEFNLAKDIGRIQAGPSRLPEHLSALEAVFRNAAQKPSNDQMAAISAVLKSKMTVITGGPGTGKTATIKLLLEYVAYLGLDIKIGLCAPTGMAAKRMSGAIPAGREFKGSIEKPETPQLSGQTIHRLLGWQGKGLFRFNGANKLRVDLLVIDEVSMIDVQLMSSLMSAAPDHCTVVFLGDVDQLPSIKPGNVLHDLIGFLPTATLSFNFRQAGAKNLIESANRIKSGQMPSPGGGVVLDNSESCEKIMRELMASWPNLAPREVLKKVQVLSPVKKGPTGTIALNKCLQALFVGPQARGTGNTTAEDLAFLAGDKVIQIKNNYDKEVMNGDIGYVSSVADDTVYVEFDPAHGGPPGVIPYTKRDLDQLLHAYAITVHKSQGSEFEYVIMVVAECFTDFLSRDLVFTGFTRARRSVALIGKKANIQRGLANDSKPRRLTGLGSFFSGDSVQTDDAEIVPPEAAAPKSGPD